MIAYHVRVKTVDDYVTRREPHRRAHLDRLIGLRGMGIVIAGGPAADGSSADLFYRVQQPPQIQRVVEEDPYFAGGVWTSYTPRSFSALVEPWEAPPVVLDGSRRVTVVEGTMSDPDMAQFALIEMRGAGRIALGGLFADGASIALARSDDAETALGWFRESGFWAPASLVARPLLHVL